MSVKIRLRRMGRKKQPHYRVVVADSASPRDGRFVESLGYYKPLTHPARLVVDLERVDYWISQGALPSHTVKSLISKARKGGDETIAVGEPDVVAEKARKAEALAAKRKGDKETEAEKSEAAAEAKPEVEEAPAPEAEAEASPPEAEAAPPEAEAEVAPEDEDAPEAEAVAEAEVEAAPEAEAEAEGEAAPEAEPPTAEAEAAPEAEAAEPGADEPEEKPKAD